jgi:hypothetical protein
MTEIDVLAYASGYGFGLGLADASGYGFQQIHYRLVLP